MFAQPLTMLLAVVTILLLKLNVATSDFTENFTSPLDFVFKNELDNREKRETMRPFCSEAQEHPFANCYALRISGKCRHSHLLKRWCPRTCKFCIAKRLAAPPTCMATQYGCCANGISAALGKDRLGCPENCKDNPLYFCAWYARNGYCSKYHKTLSKYCPKSCNFCGKIIVNGGCYNEHSDDKCESFKRFGYCKMKRFKERVAKMCARSCRVCTLNAPKLEDVTPACAAEGCCWDNRSPISHGCPPCQDYFSQTLCHRFKSECDHANRLQSTQMKTFCPNTCGICDRRTCRDDTTFGNFCSIWKGMGECKKNPNGMKLYCRKTCGFCS